jgi:peptide/nickel transport system ATP-binding protein
MVFQNPGESLSHRMTVLELVREPLDVQRVCSKQQAEDKTVRVIQEVQLPVHRDFLTTYPHHLSGGELQRVAIARALVLDPDLLIADEPTSALDPSVQAKILKLLLSLQESRGLSMLFITHDIAVARKISDRMAVMIGGRIVEEGPLSKILSSPKTSYSKELIASAPSLQKAFGNIS